jgi:hypothetical protein
VWGGWSSRVRSKWVEVDGVGDAALSPLHARGRVVVVVVGDGHWEREGGGSGGRCGPVVFGCGGR